jgi:hypothetical protein
VIVARGEGVEVVKTVQGDGVLRGIVADGSGVAGNLSLSDVVSGLRTEEEAIPTEDGVGGECGALNAKLNRPNNGFDKPHLEHVKSATGVNTGLLVSNVQESGL